MDCKQTVAQQQLLVSAGRSAPLIPSVSAFEKEATKRGKSTKSGTNIEPETKRFFVDVVVQNVSEFQCKVVLI